MKKEDYIIKARELNIRGRSRMNKEELKTSIMKEKRKIKRRMKGGGLTLDDINSLIYRNYEKNPMIYREYEDDNETYHDYRIYKIKKEEIPITYQPGDGILWKRDTRDILQIYFYRYDNFNSRIRGKHLSNRTNIDVNKKLFISPNQKILVRIQKNEPVPLEMFKDAEVPPIRLTKNGKKPYYDLALNHNEDEETPINI